MHMGTADGNGRVVITMEQYLKLPQQTPDDDLHEERAVVRSLHEERAAVHSLRGEHAAESSRRIGRGAEGSSLYEEIRQRNGMLLQRANDVRTPLLLENANPAAAGWDSSCMIDRCFYVREGEKDGGLHVCLGARADMKEPCDSLQIRLLTYEKDTRMFRELRTAEKGNTSHLCCDVEWEFSGSEAELEAYIPYAEFTWTDKEGRHNASQVSRFRYRLDELFAKYEQAWPKKEDKAQLFDPSKPQPVPVYGSGKTPPPFSENDPDSYVLVALYRAPWELRDCDYVCYVGMEVEKPHIQVPFLCRLTAAKNWRFREFDAEQSYCILTGKSEDCGAVRLLAGLRGYMESGFVCKVSGDKQTAVVSLATPWKDRILQPGNMKKFFYDMDLHLEMVMESRDNPTETESAFLDLSSRNRSAASAGGEEEIVLYPVALMWGCFAEDTQIRMADGSMRRISDIRIGDAVMQPKDGRPVRVCNIWKGTEKELVVIRTKEGASVRMTREHPLCQEDGFIRAGEIKPGDTVYGEAGRKLTVASVETVPYEGHVYNLDLERSEGDGTLLANGIAAGDNGIQNGR